MSVCCGAFSVALEVRVKRRRCSLCLRREKQQNSKEGSGLHYRRRVRVACLNSGLDLEVAGWLGLMNSRAEVGKLAFPLQCFVYFGCIERSRTELEGADGLYPRLNGFFCYQTNDAEKKHHKRHLTVSKIGTITPASNDEKPAFDRNAVLLRLGVCLPPRSERFRPCDASSPV